tara:strand:+ start:17924 stop:18973 length:1050 start_codon:yes stop_codon:yes gene_type:complete
MNTRLTSVLLPALLVTSLAAQEGQAPDMSPAKELAKFEPLIGNWSGSGKMMEPGGASTNWTAEGTYRWALNKHFVQEDFIIKFEGMDAPMTFRNYLGWDRENQRYVSAVASNQGTCRLNDMSILPDGTMMQMITHHMEGVPYIERACTKVTGDTASMKIEVMMSEGGSITMIDSAMKRSEKAFECDWGEDAWMGMEPNDHMKKLRVIRGQYQTKGEMVMAPETPAMKIAGSDSFMMIWDGTVMHGKTLGFAEGDPAPYESHAFWAWDEGRKCISAVFVDNMGQIGQMDVRWVEDKLVSTSSALQMGMPTTQRFILTLDRKGNLKSGISHTCMGTLDPFVSFTASYVKRG